jgi:hypothetical protein
MSPNLAISSSVKPIGNSTDDPLAITRLNKNIK